MTFYHNSNFQSTQNILSLFMAFCYIYKNIFSSQYKYCFGSNFCAKFSLFARSFTSLFYFKKKPLLKVIVFLRKFIVKMFYQRQYTEIGFDDSKVVIPTSATKTVENHQKNLEDAELHAFLDEDSTRTLKQLSEALEVDPGTISRRLLTISKIQKERKWVP